MGIKEEQKNTAREKERADAAEQELQKVREELERIKNKP